MPKYKKMDAVGDLIAGITLGLTMVPQSIAYISIAGLPPQYGLYTAFIGSFAYAFFGSVKEVSIGPTGSICLLVFVYTTGLNVDHIMLLTFLSGLFVFFMGVFKLGFLVDFISLPVTTAFTSATSVLICTQMKDFFGITYSTNGTLDSIVKLFQNLPKSKIADCILGFSTMIVLVTIKRICERKVEDPRKAKALWLLSIGKNALVVTICSTIAFCFHKFTGDIPFAVAGHIVPGLPPLGPPSFSTIQNNQTVSFFAMTRNLAPGFIVIPMVAVLQNIAIGKAFSTGVIVDYTHEMIALGICNMLGSFVSAVPATGAFSRSAVSNTSGVRTPFAGIYSATVIFLTLTFMTPFLYYIPKACLAAVLLVAVVRMIDYTIVMTLWRCNKFDLVVCLTTFIVGIVGGVEVGLVTGIAVNMTTLLKIWTRPRIDANICVNRTGEEYLVITPEFGLYFPAVDYFTESITKASISSSIPIAIDFEHVYRIDYSGCMTVKTLIANFKKQSRQLYFFNVKPDVYGRLRTIVSEDQMNINDDLNDLKALGLCVKEFGRPLLEISHTDDKKIGDQHQ